MLQTLQPTFEMLLTLFIKAIKVTFFTPQLSIPIWKPWASLQWMKSVKP